jgi:hypothetical protein
MNVISGGEIKHIAIDCLVVLHDSLLPKLMTGVVKA